VSRSRWLPVFCCRSFLTVDGHPHPRGIKTGALGNLGGVRGCDTSVERGGTPPFISKRGETKEYVGDRGDVHRRSTTTPPPESAPTPSWRASASRVAATGAHHQLLKGYFGTDMDGRRNRLPCSGTTRTLQLKRDAQD